MKNRFVPVALRMGADALLGGGALAAGFGLRLCLSASPERLLASLAANYAWQGPLLAVLLVVSNGLMGVYTRTRFYSRRSKAVALARSVSLAYAGLVLAIYISGRPGWIPRGALLMSYALTVAGAIGGRLGRDQLLRRFTLERRERPPERAARSVLVVGGAGYIGSVLVRDLLAEGYRVRVLDSLALGEEPLSRLHGCPDFDLLRGDFRHVEPVVRAAKGMDAVIHLGAIVGDPACAVNEDETLETNLAATRLLAEVARASGVSRILFASTCSVYGACDHVAEERSRLNPVSLYAATKIDSERVLLAARERRFHPVILRLATAFGWSWRPRFDLVVNLLAARAAAEGRIQILNGEQWRPFIHVSDISRAFRRALTAPLEVVSGEVFNAGGNSMNYTLRQLAAEIVRLCPGVAVEYAGSADRRNYRVCFDKIRDRLGFQCRAGLEQGIREILQAVKRGLVTDYRHPRYSNVQLVSDRSRHSSPGAAEFELTALKFARNSLWSRAALAGASSESLLGLARAVRTADFTAESAGSFGATSP
jgi:nucleoside-diphosphate-sugar epimerase